MLKKLVYPILYSIFLGNAQISATVTNINQIEQILPAIENDTLVLFNIAEVVMDSQTDLGTSAWRKYVRNKAPMCNKPLPYNIHDELTLLVARKVPSKAVETITPPLIEMLQRQGLPVLAFTSRGRTEWYTSEVQGVDQLTEDLMHELNVHFEASQLPTAFQDLENGPYSPYYHHGIIYANHMEKGEFLMQLLQDTGYLPAKIVFIDDKYDSLEGVEKVLQELGIPFEGFWYSRTTHDHKNFSPMIAHIQLQSLIFEDQILSNEEAARIVNERYSDVDADQFFYDLLQRIDFSTLR